jgi:hypothetical protein
MKRFAFAFVCAAALLLAAPPTAPAQQPTGYTDTPFLPWAPQWRVHDDARPRPPIVDPGPDTHRADHPVAPPSDAIVLFDGTDLSGWERAKDGGEPIWKVENGVMEVVNIQDDPRNSAIRTKAAFGSCQLHVEWASPAEVKSNSQGRGNSGVFLMDLYEIQVLDSHDNVSYADGQAGAIYGQFPPLVNACRPPGQWQTYDIVFEAPQFDEAGALTRPAFVTALHNGILIHNRQELKGPMAHKKVTAYKPHPSKLPISLQDHGNPVRFRNIWLRELHDVEQGSK